MSSQLSHSKESYRLLNLSGSEDDQDQPDMDIPDLDLVSPNVNANTSAGARIKRKIRLKRWEKQSSKIHIDYNQSNLLI